METFDESIPSKRSGILGSEYSKRHKKRVKIVDQVRDVFTLWILMALGKCQ